MWLYTLFLNKAAGVLSSCVFRHMDGQGILYLYPGCIWDFGGNAFHKPDKANMKKKSNPHILYPTENYYFIKLYRYWWDIMECGFI